MSPTTHMEHGLLVSRDGPSLEITALFNRRGWASRTNRRSGAARRCLSKKLSGAASGCVSDFAVVGVALGVEADVADGRPVADLA